MPDLSQFGWNAKARRYVNLSTGQFVSLSDVRAAVDTVIDATTQDVRKLTFDLVNGNITLAYWQSQMQTTLKSLYVACGVCAGGGFAQMSQSDYGYLGSLIKPQYQYLNKFAQDIASGKQPLSQICIRAGGPLRRMFTASGQRLATDERCGTDWSA